MARMKSDTIPKDDSKVKSLVRSKKYIAKTSETKKWLATTSREVDLYEIIKACRRKNRQKLTSHCLAYLYL